MLPPTPEGVVALPDNAFVRLGLRDKIDRLRSVADEYLKQVDQWVDLAPHELFAALQTVKYVGAATAGAAVADTTNDYRFHVIPQRTLYRRWRELAVAPSGPVGEQEFIDGLVKLDPNQRATIIVAVMAPSKLWQPPTVQQAKPAGFPRADTLG